MQGASGGHGGNVTSPPAAGGGSSSSTVDCSTYDGVVCRTTRELDTLASAIFTQSTTPRVGLRARELCLLYGLIRKRTRTFPSIVYSRRYIGIKFPYIYSPLPLFNSTK